MTSLNASLTGTDARLANGAATILRIALGVMFLSHSLILKLYVFTLAGNAAFFEKLGLPAWMGYATFFAEAIGGVLLILGVQTRWVAAALLPISSARSGRTPATAGCSAIRTAAGSIRSISPCSRSCRSCSATAPTRSRRAGCRRASRHAKPAFNH